MLIPPLSFAFQRLRKMLQPMAWVLWMAAGFCGSAQACTPVITDGGNSINVGTSNTILLNRTSGFGNVIYKKSVNIDFTNCSTVTSVNFKGFSSLLSSASNGIFTILLGASASNPNPFEPVCLGTFIGNCDPAAAIVGLATGLTLEYVISTAGSAGTNCTINSSQVANTTLTRTIGLTLSNFTNVCTKKMVTATLIAKRLSSAPDPTLNSGSIVNNGYMTVTFSDLTSVDISNDLGVPKKFAYSTPPCTLSMPPGISLPAISPATVTAAATGDQIGTWQRVSISLNCASTTLAAFDRLFTWTFTKPSADNLSLLNDGGSATGMSAQIRVDKNLTNADGSINSSKIIQSGLTYMGGAKTSSTNESNFFIGFIRNNEAVSEGSFSSKATLTVTYR
jgi:hypothetical protein